MVTDRTELFCCWIEDCDCVTAGELLAFSAYVNMTVAETIARLRREGVDIIPDSAPGRL